MPECPAAPSPGRSHPGASGSRPSLPPSRSRDLHPLVVDRSAGAPRHAEEGEGYRGPHRVFVLLAARVHAWRLY
jgi:hypothetical protein